jgi:hypothetical protein
MAPLASLQALKATGREPLSIPGSRAMPRACTRASPPATFPVRATTSSRAGGRTGTPGPGQAPTASAGEAGCALAGPPSRSGGGGAACSHPARPPRPPGRAGTGRCGAGRGRGAVGSGWPGRCGGGGRAGGLAAADGAGGPGPAAGPVTGMSVARLSVGATGRGGWFFTHLPWAGALRAGAVPGSKGRSSAARPPARVRPPLSHPRAGHRPKNHPPLTSGLMAAPTRTHAKGNR